MLKGRLHVCEISPRIPISEIRYALTGRKKYYPIIPQLGMQRELTVENDYISPQSDGRSRIGRPPSYRAESSEEDEEYPPLEMSRSPSNNPRKAYSIRIIDFLPDKFSPSGKNNDPESHILGFKDYLCAQLECEELGKDDIPSALLDRFKFTLKNSSRIWYEKSKPFENIEELERNFLKEFSVGLQSRTCAAKSSAELKFNPKDKLSPFVNKMIKLNKFLEYGEDSVLADRFLAAMPADVRRLIKVSDAKTFKEMIEIAKDALEDDTSESSTLTVQDDSKTETTGAMIDMMYSVQSLKSEIDKISDSVNNKLPNMTSSRENFQRGRGQYPNRNNFQRGGNNYRGNGNYRYNGYYTQNYRYNEQRPGYFVQRQANFNQRGRPGFLPRGRGQYKPRQQLPENSFNSPGVRCYACNGIGHAKRQCATVPQGQVNQRPNNRAQNSTQNF